MARQKSVEMLDIYFKIDCLNEEKYMGRPNLLRVATKIAKFENPDIVLETLRSVLKGRVNNLTDGQ